MFSWFRSSQPPPTTSKANPGTAITERAAFLKGEKTWFENAHLIACMAAVLQSRGQSFKQKKSWLKLGNGLIIQPRLVDFHPVQEGGVQTQTTIETSHTDVIPSGIFEYQHSLGDNLEDSIIKGFEGWMDIDFPVFDDALREKPIHCMSIEVDMPAEGQTPSRIRRVLFGPPLHQATNPDGAERAEHPFCPCCMFTQFDDLIKSRVYDDNFYGIRLFATRKEPGVHLADCRVNGEPWREGEKVLIEYATTWPDRGTETRKQYAIIQNDFRKQI